MLWEPLFHKTWLLNEFFLLTYLIQTEIPGSTVKHPGFFWEPVETPLSGGVKSSWENQVLVRGLLWFAAQLNLVFAGNTQPDIWTTKWLKIPACQFAEVIRNSLAVLPPAKMYDGYLNNSTWSLPGLSLWILYLFSTRSAPPHGSI